MYIIPFKHINIEKRDEVHKHAHTQANKLHQSFDSNGIIELNMLNTWLACQHNCQTFVENTKVNKC